MKYRPMTKDRLLERRVVVGDCWEWSGSKDPCGYGRIKSLGKNFSVHRIAYELWIGSVEDNSVLHKCDNPSCFNPDHLFLGTQADNMKDMVVKGRGYQPKWAGESHPNSRLSDEDITSIKSDTRTQRVIASEYGITQAHVSNIKNGKRR